MKKILAIVFISTITFSLYGCSRAEIEKSPITVEDSANKNEGDQVVSEDAFVDETTKEDNPVDETASKEKDTINETGSSNQNTKDVTEDTPATDSNTQNGNQIPSELVPITIELEGMKETFNGGTFKSSNGYQVIYDVDRFEVKTDNNIDSFQAENPNPDLYPYVYFNIGAPMKLTLSDTIDQWKNTLSSDTKAKLKDGSTTSLNGYPTKHYVVTAGTDWNSTIQNYYFIQHKDFVYMIETQYFVEAAEGYGSRIHAMLNTVKFN